MTVYGDDQQHQGLDRGAHDGGFYLPLAIQPWARRSEKIRVTRVSSSFVFLDTTATLLSTTSRHLEVQIGCYSANGRRSQGLK